MVKKKSLPELKEKILQLYNDFQDINESWMKQLKEIFPISVPEGIDENDVYLLLLNNDFNISVETAIHYIKLKEMADKEIERMLF